MVTFFREYLYSTRTRSTENKVFQIHSHKSQIDRNLKNKCNKEECSQSYARGMGGKMRFFTFSLLRVKLLQPEDNMRNGKRG